MVLTACEKQQRKWTFVSSAVLAVRGNLYNSVYFNELRISNSLSLLCDETQF
jgi:hypothetical protein